MIHYVHVDSYILRYYACYHIVIKVYPVYLHPTSSENFMSGEIVETSAFAHVVKKRKILSDLIKLSQKNDFKLTQKKRFYTAFS